VLKFEYFTAGILSSADKETLKCKSLLINPPCFSLPTDFIPGIKSARSIKVEKVKVSQLYI